LRLPASDATIGWRSGDSLQMVCFGQIRLKILSTRPFYRASAFGCP